MKFTKKKLVAAIIAALCVLGVADVTMLDNSNLKNVLQKVESFLGDDVAPVGTADDVAPVVTAD
jgi:hypothetical protein